MSTTNPPPACPAAASRPTASTDTSAGCPIDQRATARDPPAPGADGSARDKDNASGTTTTTESHASPIPIAAQIPNRRRISTSTATSVKKPAAVVTLVSVHAMPTPAPARAMPPLRSCGASRHSSCTRTTQWTASAMAMTGSRVKNAWLIRPIGSPAAPMSPSNHRSGSPAASIGTSTACRRRNATNSTTATAMLTNGPSMA